MLYRWSFNELQVLLRLGSLLSSSRQVPGGAPLSSSLPFISTAGVSLVVRMFSLWGPSGFLEGRQHLSAHTQHEKARTHCAFIKAGGPGRLSGLAEP